MVSQTSDLTETVLTDAATRMLDAPPEAIRIAMWACPRSRATPLMRAFAQRGDTAVIDTPFYAAYLRATGLDHPMRQSILATQPHEWRRVVDQVLGPVPDEKPIWYQKHTTTHMLAEFGRDWIDQVTSAFLIRRPESIVASFAAHHDDVSLAAIGIMQQADLFDLVSDRLGQAPPVIDADDLALRPQRTLSRLCKALDIPFRRDMLKWSPGRHAADGVWAEHWYDAVASSTGFVKPQPPIAPSDLREDLQSVADYARPYYERLKAHSIS